MGIDTAYLIFQKTYFMFATEHPGLFLQIKGNWIPGSKTTGELAVGPCEQKSLHQSRDSSGSNNHIQPTLLYPTYNPCVNWALQHRFQSQDETIYNT